MKLIRQGTKHERTFRGTCHHCGSEWEAMEQELQGKITDDQRDGEFARTKCTARNCGHELILYPVKEEAPGSPSWMQR